MTDPAAVPSLVPRAPLGAAPAPGPAALREAEGPIDRPWLIDAHLMHAALSSAPVVMERLPVGSWVSGRLDLADDFGEVGFVASGPDALPRPGAEVRLRYWMGAMACELHTDVLGHTTVGRARLARPRVVRCTDRRLLLRVAVAPAAGWALRWGSPDRGLELPLADLSAGGAACVLPPGVSLIGVESEAWLLIPGEAPIPVAASLCRRWEEAGQRRIGLAFGPMFHVDLARLTQRLIRGTEGFEAPPVQGADAPRWVSAAG